jgi:hypothetical protein
MQCLRNVVPQNRINTKIKGLKEHLQEDSFEDFLRGKLNEFDDEPSSNMWERVESVIPPAPKPVLFRLMKPSAVAASMVLAVAVFAAVYQYNTKQNLNEQLIEATNKIKTLENKIDETIVEAETTKVNDVDNDFENEVLENEVSQKTNSNHSGAYTEKASNASDIGGNKKSNPAKASNQRPTKNRADKMAYSPNVDKQFNAPSSNVFDNPPLKNNTKTESLPIVDKKLLEEHKISTDNLLLSIANKVIVENQKANKLEIEETKNIEFGEPTLLAAKDLMPINNGALFVPADKIGEVEKIDPPYEYRWMVGAFVQSAKTMLDYRDRRGPSGGNPFKDHKAKPSIGWAIGAKVGLQLNKNWSVHSGMSMQEDNFKIKLVDHLQYNNIRETPASNNKNQYLADYITQTPLGEMGIKTVFLKDKDLPILENQPFDIKIDGNHRLTSVNIPIYAQVQHQKGAFAYGLKLGASFQYIAKTDFKIEAYEATFPTAENGSIEIVRPPKLNSKWSADALIGAVFSYNVSDHIALSFEPTALVGLGSKHATNFGHTESKSLGSQLAVRYIF